MRSNIEGARLSNNLLMEGNKQGAVLVPSATGAAVVLDEDVPPYVGLALTTATNIQLPTEARGLRLTLANESTGAFVATVQGSTGGALSPATTLAQNEVLDFVCGNDLTWRAVQKAYPST